MKGVVVTVCVGVAVACNPKPASPNAAPSNAAPQDAAPSDALRSGDTAPIVVTDANQVPSLVGKLVTLVGEQTRTKQPTVLGVDVDGDDALSDQSVRVTGILRRRVIERDPNQGAAPGEIVATRGPGTYYSIIDPATRVLARPKKAK